VRASPPSARRSARRINRHSLCGVCYGCVTVVRQKGGVSTPPLGSPSAVQSMLDA
jgi:hypothetical protein